MSTPGDDELDTDQRIRRSTTRILANWTIIIVSLALIVAWGMQGIYYLQPGEASVVLFLGKYHDTNRTPGMRWRLPAPFGSHQIVNVQEMRHIEFGVGALEREAVEEDKVEDETAFSVDAVQTADSNIVIPRYVVQYTIKSPFSYLYTMQWPERMLHDATQAAVREVIGRHTVDEVLSGNRAGIQRDAKAILEEILVSYAGGDKNEAAFEIRSISLQSVLPPAPVQEAFDDVSAASQDEERAESVARGDAREILEKANAEAVELTESANAYKEGRVLEAQGEADRFESLLAEYRVAKDVTRTRLYLETMEQVLPKAEKIVVDDAAVQTLPLLSLPKSREGAN